MNKLRIIWQLIKTDNFIVITDSSCHASVRRRWTWYFKYSRNCLRDLETRHKEKSKNKEK